jgi:lactoylglutathione lyase
MQSAKNNIDVGLSTNNLEPMLRFWQQDVAIRFRANTLLTRWSER